MRGSAGFCCGGRMTTAPALLWGAAAAIPELLLTVPPVLYRPLYRPPVPQGEVEINLEEARGPLREWIAQEPVRREVRRRFARLLKTFTDESGDYVYRQRVRDMVRSECLLPAAAE